MSDGCGLHVESEIIMAAGTERKVVCKLDRHAARHALPLNSVILVMIFQLKLSYSFDFLVTVIVLVNYRGIF